MGNGQIRDELSQALIDDAALRHEVTSIAMSGLSGKPSDRYIQWKHKLNEQARRLGIPVEEMLTAVIDRAIDMNRP